jgi:tetratricopeptide (TPR) repeat protein
LDRTEPGTRPRCNGSDRARSGRTPLQVGYGGRAREPSFTQAEELITQALALAPDLPEAIVTSATLTHRYRDDYRRSEAEFQRSIALNPNYATAHHWYSDLLLDMSRRNEALQQIQIALELDPISTILISISAEVLASLGRFDEALAQSRKAIEIDPMTPVPYSEIGTCTRSDSGNWMLRFPGSRRRRVWIRPIR